MKTIKKSDNEASEVVLESIRMLFAQENVAIPDACIDHAHCASKTNGTNDTVIVRFTTFRYHTTFYRKRKALKGGVTVHPDLNKSRLDLPMRADKYAKNISTVEFAYSDINCCLKVQFKNTREVFFESIEDLISKIDF